MKRRARQESPMPRFIVHADGDRKEIVLDKSSVMIGRGTGSDLRIGDRLASRAHCRIDWDGATRRSSTSAARTAPS